MAKKEKIQDPLRREKLIVGGVLGAIFIAIVAFVAYYFISNNYFIKIDGKTVASEKEYRLNLMSSASMYLQFGMDLNEVISEDGQTIMDMLKEETLANMIRNKVIMAEAKKENIAFLKDEEQTYEEKLLAFTESLGEEIIKNMELSKKEIEDIYQGYLYSEAMYETVTKDYEQDETAYKTYLEGYLADEKKSYTTINLEYIDTEDMETAEALKVKLEAGEDFETLYRAYSVDYKTSLETYEKDLTAYKESMENAENTETTATEPAADSTETATDSAEAEAPVEPENPADKEITPTDSNYLTLTEADKEDMYRGPEGRIFISFEEENSYIFRIAEIIEADETKMTADALEKFDNEQKNIMFDIKYNEWREKYFVEYNENLYKSIAFN